MRTLLTLSGIVLTASMALCSPAREAAAQTTPPVSSVTGEEAREIAANAYVYAYPLIIMELTRRATTNVEQPVAMHAPINQFAHVPSFPDATFTDVVRANADTLYSSLQFDVSQEPIVISVPDSGGRYYLLPMLDMWTDVFASPGSRTTGNGAQTFALTGPGWQGTLPEGVMQIKAPTAQGWIIGRTKTDGPSDYPAVHRFQHGMSAVPLSRYGKSYAPPKGQVDSSVPKTPPVEWIEQLSPEDYFSLFCGLMKINPPHANDNSILMQMRRLGIEPGKSFSLAALSPEVRSAIQSAAPEGMKRIKAHLGKSGVAANGWRTSMTAVGTYGADYLSRAAIAYAGLGANTIEDAVYPSAFGMVDGRPFDSGKRYVLHFDKDQIPPVRAFWSLTMYNDKQLFAANPINRYAIGDRDKLAFNPDGSLDLYIQRDSPGKDKESNWLPAPANGPFTMNLRLYWPKEQVLDQTWVPPAVKEVN